MESGWVQDGTKAIGLLSLIQIVSVPSVVKLVWIDCAMVFLTTDGIRMGGRIDPMHSGGIFNHKGHEVTRGGEGKDERGKVENRENRSQADNP